MTPIPFIWLMLLLTAIPQAWAGPETRPPAVSGSFYPADPGKLKAVIANYTDRADLSGVHLPENATLKALVMPHAGYVYSGPVAAHVHFLLKPHAFSKVIVMGPDHRVGFSGCAVSDAKNWLTPLGSVPVHPDAAALIKASLIFSPVAESDRLEHGIEVILPFLQTYVKDFSLVPVVTGSCDFKPVAQYLAGLIDPSTLVVVSTDLSHYLPYNRAIHKDQETIWMILNLDQERLAKSSNAACGKIPLLILMEIAKMKQWTPYLLHYSNSGDTEGDKQRVVGYTAMAFFQEPESGTGLNPGNLPPETNGNETVKHEFSEDQGKLLVELARKTIAGKLGKPPSQEAASSLEQALDQAVFKQDLASFVTLHINGRLRGCIGTLEASEPLVDNVRNNALNAAFSDPRFSKLSRAELDLIDIEVSILTPPEKLAYSDAQDLLSKLEPGVHGVILKKNWARATFLPQVWDQLPDKKDFLSHLCQKAGLSANEWKKGDLEVFTYRVQYFEEE